MGSEEGEETYTVAPPSSSGDEDESLSGLSELTYSKKEDMVTTPSAETRGSGVGGPMEEEEEEERERGVGVAATGMGKPQSSRKKWANDEVSSAAD